VLTLVQNRIRPRGRWDWPAPAGGAGRREVVGRYLLELDPGDICLIASHVWDTIGAGAAGLQAALILREGNAPLDVGPQPDYIGKDLDVIADQLIERYAAAGNASTPQH
jgi:hypothetical protein